MPIRLMDIRNATKVYGGGFVQGGGQVVALQAFNLTIYEDPATITTIAGESGRRGAEHTQLLIASIPSIKEKKPLKVTEGLTHDLRNPPPGCVFQFRCLFVMDRCKEAPPPPLLEVKPDHCVACYLC